MQKQIEGFRLSPQQARLWPLQHKHPSVYRAQAAVLIEGAVEAARVKEAVRQVVARHEILRTTFRRVRGVSIPLQVVEEGARFDWEQVTLGTAEAERSSIIEEVFRQEGLREFDLERGPVARFLLAEVSGETRVLFVSLPALCADFATLKGLAREIAEAYGASAAASGAGEGDEPTQFVQFSEWQNELSEEEDADEAAKEFWRRRRQLRSESGSASPLPGRAAHDAGSEPERVTRTLTADAFARLRATAERHGVTTETWLLACWQALLWRLTGEPVFVVDVLSDGRKFEELAEAFGPISQFLPVDCRFDSKLTSAECASRVEQTTRGAREWQEYFTSAEFAQELEGEAAGGVAFEFLSWPGEHSEGGARFSLLRQYTRPDDYKIKLTCAERQDTLDVEFYAAREEFERASIERLAEQFTKILDSSTLRPESAVNELEIIGDDERERLLREWNDTRREYPRLSCLHELFEAQVEKTPERVALADGEEELTYRELNRRANKVAHHLRSLGVAAEQRVGVCVERSIELVVGLLGVFKAGAAYVPLDATHPPQRLAWTIEDAKPTIVLTSRSVAGKLQSQFSTLVRLDDDWTLLEEQPDGNPAAAASPQNLAYVIYTSGSTGRPKGVMVTHQGLVNYLSWCAQEYDAGGASGAPVHSSIGFDLTVTSLFAPLVAGGRTTLLREDAGVEALAASLRAEGGFSFVKLTPSHLKVLAQLLPKERAARQPKALVVGGEALWSSSLAYWREHAPQTRIINEYGPTETVVGCCVYESPAGALRGEGAVPIGGPIANTQLYLLDEGLNLVPTGATGELYVGGDGVARGYLNRPELTAEKFVPDPFSAEPGARLYRTGDLARYVSQGCIEYLGRADEQVKVRGYRIEPGEIESALARSEAVREVVVTARDDDAGEKFLVAYVVPRAGRVVAAGELRAFLAAVLPDYMIPAAFVTLQKLPLTANGKVDRRALPAPDTAHPELRSGYVAPRSALEEFVTHVWTEVLGVERIGVNDNFFELGGHSIKAMQVVARLLDSFQVELPPGMLFEATTVAELARLLEQHEPQPGLMEKIARVLKKIEGIGEAAERPSAAAAEQQVEETRARTHGAS